MVNLNYIKNKRNKNKMSLDKVAKLLGYSTAYGYWKVENGLTKLKAEHITKLQKVLDLRLEELLKEETNNEV